MRKLVVVAGLAAVGGLVALTAQAQFSRPDDAIKYRQAAYTIMGAQMTRIFNELKSPTPNVQAIQRSAGIVDFASTLPGEGYVPGSEKGNRVSTKAKPEVFTDPKVAQLGREMRTEVVKLNEVAKTGDVAAIRKQFEAAAQTCDNCHDNFRLK
jgi:cytochrome c556